MKEKQKYKLEQPMKRLNWTKIQTQRLKENSFWVKANEEKFASDDVFQMLVENFSTKAVKTKFGESKTTNDETTGGVKKKALKELKFLDDKQAQNLNILLRSLKADAAEICRWLIECDMDKLTLNSLEQFDKALPEDTVLGQYQQLKENIEELDPSEQFLVVVSKIKGLRKRIRGLIFKHKFPEQQEEIKCALVAGTQACLDVRKSDKFQKLLEVLLLVGNFMNSGSSNLEGSIGFDIKFLPKFYGTKANDNRRTLLHLVAQIISEKHPYITNFYEDFAAFLEPASKIDQATITKGLNDIKVNINHVDLDLRNASKQQRADQPNDKFAQTMETFAKEAQARFETLECMHQKMNEAYKELADFLAIEQSKYPLGELFTDLRAFTQQYQQCVDENQKLRETEEKIRRAEEERKQREQEKAARKCQKEKLMQTKVNGDEMGDTGVMDNLLEALQSGKLFEVSANGGPTPPHRVRRAQRDGRHGVGDFKRIVHKPPTRAVLQEVQ